MKLPWMRATSLLLALTVVALGCQTNDKSTSSPDTAQPEFGLVVHGGAGYINPDNRTPEQDSLYHTALSAALEAGYMILSNGGTSQDAVQAAIMVMEESPLFNSAVGAVLTHKGDAELDASFMDGATLKAGAVGGVKIIKSPITAAIAVMEHTDHVLLTGRGAEEFAITQGLDTVSNDYFILDRRRATYEKQQNEKGGNSSLLFHEGNDYKMGTVGAAALDMNGNLAAGTSTGGMANKKYGRLGDSPIIGAGTYANNATCAVSCTGHGEYFIRYAVAHDVSALMEYKGMTFEAAAEQVINEKLVKAGGAGGLIGIDKAGNVAMPFNTTGMYRGYWLDGMPQPKTLMYPQ